MQILGNPGAVQRKFSGVWPTSRPAGKRNQKDKRSFSISSHGARVAKILTMMPF
jgi:hypothetical protein